MKKFLLTLLCAAATMAGSAKEVYFDFTGTGDAYGMTRTSDSNYYNPKPTTISITDTEKNVVNVTLTGNNRLWSDGLRFHKGSAFEVVAPENYVITKIEIGDFLKNGTTAQDNHKKFTAPEGEGKFSEGIWSGSQSSIKLTSTVTSGGSPITSLKITFEEDSYAPANLAFAEASVSAELGKDFTAPELTKDTDGTPTYTSSNPDAATVDAETGAVTLVGAGVTTITATVAKTETHNPGSAYYTLTVIDSNAIVITGDATFSFTSEGAYNIGGSLTTTEKKIEEGDVSLNIKIDAGTGYRIYESSGAYELRIQAKDSKGATLTFTVPEGAQITSVEFNGAAVTTSVMSFDSNNGEYKYDSTEKSGVWTAKDTYKSNVLTCSTKNQAKINSIKVSYSITVSKPQTPIASDGENEFTHNDVITLKEESGKTLHFTLPEGMNLYYKFEVVKDNNSESSSDESIQTLAEHVPAEGFTKYVHEDGIKLTQSGKLSYYAEKNGVVGDTHVITVQNDATAIAEVEAGAGVTEWYDLSGRKVAAPGKGVYVRKQGSKVAKIAL